VTEPWDGRYAVRNGERFVCQYCTRNQKNSSTCMKCGADLKKPALTFEEMVARLKGRPL